MDTNRVSAAIRRQVGALHQRRHPSKGVVVEFEGFADEVARRTQLLKRLSKHTAARDAAILMRSRRARNQRRLNYIKAEIDEGSPLSVLSIMWENDEPNGFQITTRTGNSRVTNHFFSDDKWAQDALSALFRRDGAVILHSYRLVEENLSAMGFTIPNSNRVIDTALLGLMLPNRGPDTPSSTEVGNLLGIQRSDYSSYDAYMFALLDEMFRRAAEQKLYPL